MKRAAFYSYKGGVGRSLLVANLSLLLARAANLRVVVVDFDLEAPGLHYKFASTPDLTKIQAGLVDYLHARLVTPDEEPPLLPLLQIHQVLGEGSVHLLPAGVAPLTSYWDKLAAINWVELMRDVRGDGLRLFAEMFEALEAQSAPDVVLLDVRTGVTDIGGIATQMLADTVFCLGLAQQEHTEGLRAVMRGIQADAADREGARVVAVLSRVTCAPGSADEHDLRRRTAEFFSAPGPTPSGTLSFEPDDIEVLHAHREVERDGRLLLQGPIDAATGGALLWDYFTLGALLLDTADSDAMRRWIANTLAGPDRPKSAEFDALLARFTALEASREGGPASDR